MRILRILKQLFKKYSLKIKITFLTLQEFVAIPMHNGFPVPPPKMRQLTTAGNVTVKEHINNGQQAANMITQNLEKTFYSNEMSINILEFGCGCGRVLRHLRFLLPNAKLHGCDVDETLINWNIKNLNFVSWYLSDYNPPTIFNSQMFDLVYAISVFTHIDEKTQLKWLHEFKRILKPKGLLFITVNPLKPDEKLGSWDYNNNAGMVLKYRKKEVVNRTWIRQKTEHDHYIDTKHSILYCKNIWGQYFDYINFFPGALRGVQALVILRKK